MVRWRTFEVVAGILRVSGAPVNLAILLLQNIVLLFIILYDSLALTLNKVPW